MTVRPPFASETLSTPSRMSSQKMSTSSAMSYALKGTFEDRSYTPPSSQPAYIQNSSATRHFTPSGSEYRASTSPPWLSV